MEMNVEKIAIKVTEKVLDDLLYKGKTLREWIDLIIKFEKEYEILPMGKYPASISGCNMEKEKMKDIEDPKTFLRIVVNDIGEKPYYEIEYLDKDGNLHTGYGSFIFELVKRWKATEFEYYK